jgi:hypothetical protein
MDASVRMRHTAGARAADAHVRSDRFECARTICVARWRCPKGRADPNGQTWSEHVRMDKKWVKVLPTGRPKWNAEAGLTLSWTICGHEMGSGGQRPWWLAVRASPNLARTSVNQKIWATVALNKKLPATIFLLATPTLCYSYSQSPRRHPCSAAAYSRLSPQPGSKVFEPSSSAWRARMA